MREQEIGSLLWSKVAVEGKSYSAIWRPSDQGSPLPAKPEEPTPLHILYFCDAHGNLFSEAEGIASFPARLQAQRASIEGDVLILSGGDDHGAGNPWDVFMATDSGKSPSYELYEAAGLDAFTIGNHDLDWGADRFAAVLGASSIPAVVSNNLNTSPLRSLTDEALVFEFEDKLVGVLGLANYSDVLEAKSLFEDPREALLPYMEELSECLNCLIVISHLGYENQLPIDDHGILKQIPTNTLVCGSHSHLTIPPLDSEWLPTHYLQSSSQFKVYGHAHWKPGQPWLAKNQATDHLPLISPTPSDLSIKESLKDEIERRGTVEFDHGSFRLEQDTGQRYREENPRLNWSCDQLWELADSLNKGPFPSLVGLCARFLGSGSLDGKMNTSSWYRNFPYGDRLASFLIPKELLQAFLQSNAQRLLLPDHYLESAGWLQFDRTLRQTITSSDSTVSLTTFSFENDTDKANNTDKIRLFTQAYVACGSGGYRQRFERLNFQPEDVTVYPLSLREYLWGQAKLADSNKSNPLDGRLKIMPPI